MAITNPERLCELITDFVAEGGYRPGDRVATEADLAERFGVSKSVTRDAVHRLRGAGLLESRRRGGLYVAKDHLFDVLRFRLSAVTNDQQGIEDIYGMRAVIDIGCAQLLVGRVGHGQLAELGKLVDQMVEAKTHETFRQIDSAFHRSLYRAVGNRLLADFGEMLTDLFHRVSTPTGSLTPMRRRDLAERHRAIVSALTHRDLPTLVNAINDHYGGKMLQEIADHAGQIAKPKVEGEGRGESAG